MSIIVDGYNYIGRSVELTLQDTGARDKIIYLFGQYCARAQKMLTIVFDGSYSGQQVDRKRQYGRVTVIYTSPIYSADHAIKKMVGAQEPKRRKKLTVVSSDNEIADYVKVHGASAMKSEEFEQEIIRTLAEEKKFDRVNIHITDEEVQEWLKLFGHEPAEPKKAEKKPVISGQQAKQERESSTPAQPSTKNTPAGKLQATPRSRVREDDDQIEERRDRKLSKKEVDEWLKIFGAEDD
ncbi:hypothetical cytosolic protein [Candidatus Moduliflexus flocculans]|uniref:Hypothetical cytosolic protein n=1 Tax=Candidatus Moduliflexus flocculans TaxID=1499966 RepID=A0A0S6W3N6_9BACT|nr:hypothetical cytosolic protein [Candidatus Moduliflexus flocculans]